MGDILLTFLTPVSSIPGIEEVNMIREDGSVVHFNNPKVQDVTPFCQPAKKWVVDSVGQSPSLVPQYPFSSLDTGLYLAGAGQPGR